MDPYLAARNKRLRSLARRDPDLAALIEQSVDSDTAAYIERLRSMDPAYVRHFKPEHIKELAPKLREIDKRERQLILGVSPEEGLIKSALSSDWVRTVFAADGEVVGIFGVGKEGDVWLVSSDRLTEPATASCFLSKCWTHLDIMHDYHPLLRNCVHAGNRVRIMWLKRLDFSFMRRLTIKREPFYEFVKLKVEGASRLSPNRAEAVQFAVDAAVRIEEAI